jgi:hypothetical protein
MQIPQRHRLLTNSAEFTRQVLGVINRSEMARILIAYYGIHSGVARVKPTKALRLLVSSQASE